MSSEESTKNLKNLDVIHIDVIARHCRLKTASQQVQKCPDWGFWNIWESLRTWTYGPMTSFTYLMGQRTEQYFLNYFSYIEHDKVCGFWTWLFVLSKLPELGDTIFIVLRKQPLIFLHWYHHITVLMYSWFSYSEYTASARWFVVMNYCVHSLMYTYYALRALKFQPPRFISMVITALQLTQMVVGCAINVWAHGFLQQAGHAACNISPTNIKFSIAMYASYFILFARFFHLTYLSSNARKGKKLATSSMVSQQAKQLDHKVKAQ